MPIFEFVCAECGKPFEMLVLYSSRAEEATCPECHSQNVTKKISSFASRLSGSSSFSFSNSSSSSCTTSSV